MTIKNAFIPEDDQRLCLTKKFNVKFDTRFGFLKEHYGLRPKCIHMVAGATSSGMSTLVRSLLTDVYKNNAEILKTMVWLGGESIREFQVELTTAPISEKSKRNIACISEIDSDGDENSFFETVESHNPEILIIDSITTSRFYNYLRPNQQAKFFRRLRRLAEKKNMAIILVAHTTTDATLTPERLANMNDITGSLETGMVCEIFYMIQKTMIGGDLKTILKVMKKRGYSGRDNTFQLVYDKEKRIFSRDRQICNSDLLEYLRLKNKR